MNIGEIISNTLFLTKYMEHLYALSEKYPNLNIVACNSSDLYESYIDTYIHERNVNYRFASTSSFFYDLMFEEESIIQSIKNFKNIWTFQAYPWTDDLKLLKKTVYCINYYDYLRLSDKFEQIRLLKTYGDSLLQGHLQNRQDKFSTDFIVYRKYYQSNKYPFVATLRDSAGGSGVYFVRNLSDWLSITKKNKYEVVRIESFKNNMIPVNQSAVVFKDGCVKYQPSIQIIENKSGNFVYMGADYLAASRLLNKNLNISICRLTDSIGKALSGNGYFGMYGCDYLVDLDSNEAWFIELNPRFQASTFLLNQSSMKEISERKSDLSAEKFEAMTLPHALHICAFERGFIPNSLSKYGDDSEILMRIGDDKKTFVSFVNHNYTSTIKKFSNDLILKPIASKIQSGAVTCLQLSKNQFFSV